MASQGRSLLAFEAHLLESTPRASTDHTQQILSLEQAEVAVERPLLLEKVCLTDDKLQLVPDRYLRLEEIVCTSAQDEK
jgi:hypothetical protein